MTYSTPAAAAAPTGPRRAAAAAAVLLLGACCVALSVRAPAGWSADVLHSAAQPAAGLEAAAPLMGKNGKKLSKHALEVRIAHAQAKVEKFKKPAPKKKAPKKAAAPKAAAAAEKAD